MRRIVLVVLSSFALVSCTSTVEPSLSVTPSTFSEPSTAPQSALNSPFQTPTIGPVMSPSPTERSIPTASVASGELQWTRIEQPVASINGDLGIPIASGDRFYLIDAYGSYPDITWVLVQSLDGLDWSVVSTLPDGAAPGAFFQAPAGLLAGGVQSVNGSAAVGLWSAQGGSDWTSLSDQPAFSEKDCAGSKRPEIDGFYPLGSAIVAVGSAVWSSSDGASWHCVATTPDLHVVGGHDALLGTPKPQTGVASGSIWLSTDGAHWTKTKDVEFAVDVAAIRTGFVAVTSWYGAHDALFTSADGQHWADQANPFGTQDVASIASDGERAVVLEVAEGPGGVSPGGVWVSSPDGATWTRYQIPTREGDEAVWVAILANHLVATGRNNGSSVLWAAEIPS